MINGVLNIWGVIAYRSRESRNMSNITCMKWLTSEGSISFEGLTAFHTARIRSYDILIGHTLDPRVEFWTLQCSESRLDFTETFIEAVYETLTMGCKFSWIWRPTTFYTYRCAILSVWSWFLDLSFGCRHVILDAWQFEHGILRSQRIFNNLILAPIILLWLYSVRHILCVLYTLRTTSC